MHIAGLLSHDWWAQKETWVSFPRKSVFLRKSHWIILRKRFCSWCISSLCLILLVIIFYWNVGLSDVNHTLGHRVKQTHREQQRGLTAQSVVPGPRAWGKIQQMERALVKDPYTTCVCPRGLRALFYPISFPVSLSFNSTVLRVGHGGRSQQI